MTEKMRRALIVGIDDYQQAPLNGCVNDANAIAAVLSTHATGAPNFDILLLTSPPTSITRASLLPQSQSSSQRNVTPLFYSSQAMVLYVAVTDGIVTNDAQRYDEGILMTDILGRANRSPVKNKVIIFDCCYSGNMGSPGTTGDGVSQLAEGLTVLTASRSSEVAMERDGGGVFTALVSAALHGGAADLRGHITPGAIYAYVDQALGAWDQRPIFKTNVTQFTSLREVQPQVPLETLRKLPLYFPTPQGEHNTCAKL